MRADLIEKIENYRITFDKSFDEMLNLFEVVLPTYVYIETIKFVEDNCFQPDDEMYYNEFLASLEENFLSDIVFEIEEK